MEEFKNLKEIIELCQEELKNNDENVNATLDFEDLKELQSLINKYKKQEKVIELMADYISIQKWGNTESKESIKKYFKKKAKGE